MSEEWTEKEYRERRVHTVAPQGWTVLLRRPKAADLRVPLVGWTEHGCAVMCDPHVPGMLVSVEDVDLEVVAVLPPGWEMVRGGGWGEHAVPPQRDPIATELDRIAYALRCLGTADAATPMGAIEFLACEVKEIAPALREMAEAIRWRE